MTICFVAIGDEVLRGETREGNAVQLATRLQSLSVALDEVRVVADTAAAVAHAVRDLAENSALIITSGGLGPTDDDGTRAAIAAVAGTDLYEDADLADGIRQRYERLGRDWIALNLKQACIPTGSLALPNRHGTAPGFAIDVGSCLVVCLPGPPRELRGMLDDHLPQLLGRANIPTSEVREQCIRVFGTTESGLQHQLRGIDGYDDVRVRSLPSFPEIRLEIRAAPHATDAAAEAFATRVRQALGWRYFADNRHVSYAQVVVDELLAQALTLAVAESCTGGLTGHLLTDVPGVSACLQADLVTYSNTAKRDVLGVEWATIEEHGAVSEPVARAMAEGARRVGNADYAVSTTGIAGPTGGTEDKPVGTVWFGVAGPAGTTAYKRVFPGMDRWRFKRLAAWSALALLRRTLINDTKAP